MPHTLKEFWIGPADAGALLLVKVKSLIFKTQKLQIAFSFVLSAWLVT